MHLRICWYKNSNFSYRTKLKLGDAFVGYQDDTPAAVVFQAYHHLEATKQWEAEDTMSEEQQDQVSYKSTYIHTYIHTLSNPVP